jgi:hypothetical protein
MFKLSSSPAPAEGDFGLADAGGLFGVDWGGMPNFIFVFP